MDVKKYNTVVSYGKRKTVHMRHAPYNLHKENITFNLRKLAKHCVDRPTYAGPMFYLCYLCFDIPRALYVLARIT